MIVCLQKLLNEELQLRSLRPVRLCELALRRKDQNHEMPAEFLFPAHFADVLRLATDPVTAPTVMEQIVRARNALLNAPMNLHVVGHRSAMVFSDSVADFSAISKAKNEERTEFIKVSSTVPAHVGRVSLCLYAACRNEKFRCFS